MNPRNFLAIAAAFAAVSTAGLYAVGYMLAGRPVAVASVVAPPRNPENPE